MRRKGAEGMKEWRRGRRSTEHPRNIYRTSIENLSSGEYMEEWRRRGGLVMVWRSAEGLEKGCQGRGGVARLPKICQVSMEHPRTSI